MTSVAVWQSEKDATFVDHHRSSKCVKLIPPVVKLRTLTEHDPRNLIFDLHHPHMLMPFISVNAVFESYNDEKTMNDQVTRIMIFDL